MLLYQNQNSEYIIIISAKREVTQKAQNWVSQKRITGGQSLLILKVTCCHMTPWVVLAPLHSPRGRS